MATPPSPARASSPSRSNCRICAASAPAARSTSSSTTRSALPPPRRRRAPAPTRPTSPRASRRRSFTSTATIPEAVVEVARAALEYRQRFNKDVVDRPVLLSPPRPQRGRRAGLHPAADVPHDRAPPDDAAALRRAARRRGRVSRGRGRDDGEPISSPISKPSSRRPRTTARTRPTGSKAPGPGSSRRPI